jgi:hypothetical protein
MVYIGVLVKVVIHIAAIRWNLGLIVKLVQKLRG